MLRTVQIKLYYKRWVKWTLILFGWAKDCNQLAKWTAERDINKQIHYENVILQFKANAFILRIVKFVKAVHR